MSRAVLFWLALILLFAGSMALWAGYSYLNSGHADPKPALVLPETALEGFTLIERSGRDFHSNELKGKVWIASFFFATCPSFCPAQNQKVSQLAQVWGPRGVTFVSITVDPERDTPALLADYARKYQADKDNWLFLTGPLPLIERVGTDIFQVNVAKETHSGHLIVVDRTGKKRGLFNCMSKSDVQRMEEFLEELLAEEPAKEQEKKTTAEKPSDKGPAEEQPGKEVAPSEVPAPKTPAEAKKAETK